ncbi:MAG TPA: LysE family translocator, partial [Solirubrobacteraceae bacterium]|nr:LysE family translocator [Solirubrobacteraceae bacterium]
HLLVYVGIVVAIVLLPGPDTAIVTKNALIHGREAALGSAIGSNVGVSIWTLATALGLAAILKSSATVYEALKLIGALYLVWIGVRTLWDSRRAGGGRDGAAAARRVLDARGGFRQGLLTDLANPKVGIFFTSLLPQFVSPHGAALPQMLILGAIYIAFSLVWMCGYALAAVRLSHLLNRARVKAGIDRFSGLVLVGVGIRLAIER